MDSIRLATTDDPFGLARFARALDRIAAGADAPGAEPVLTPAPRDPSRVVETLARRVVLGEADACVAAVSDLPDDLPRGVEIAAMVRDRELRYFCVSRRRPVLSLLPAGSRVVTCDRVARAQILHRFPWLWVEMGAPCEEILAGLRQGLWDAACAPAEVLEAGSAEGLQSEGVPVDQILPSPGQGAIAILTASPPRAGALRLRKLDDPEMRAAWSAERIFVRCVSGAGQSLSAACAVAAGGLLQMTGLIADRDGNWLVSDNACAPLRYADTLAREIADSCREQAMSPRREAAPMKRGAL